MVLSLMRWLVSVNRMISPTRCGLVLLCLVCGCSSSARLNPKTIEIRNLTDRQAQTVSIQDDRDATDGPRRVGSLGPVLPAANYPYVRPDGAPPLPAKVRVTVTFPGGEKQSTVLDLNQAMKQ